MCEVAPGLVNLKCAVHVINLIMKDIITHEIVEPWAKSVFKSVTFFTKADVWKRELAK